MFRKTKISVGVLGLGIIGSRVAAHLRAAGFQVPVWNRTPKPEPGFLGSPAEVAEAADIIQLFVADAAAVFEMIEAMGSSLTERHTLLCSATIGREATLEAARRVAERGARFVDAPFTGSKEAAQNAQLLYFVGAEDATLTSAVRRVLEASGGKGVLQVGEVGQAAVLKVVTNVLSAVTVETLAEMLAVVKAAGISAETFGQVLEKHGIRSGLLDMKYPRMVAGDYEETHFALKHMLKDVRLGLDLGRELSLDLPVTQRTADLMADGIGHGWAELDFSCLAKRYP